VVIGDLSSDGRPDLAVADAFSSTATALLNIGPGMPTPIALALVDAHATTGRVDLRWYSASMAGMAARVYRRTTQSVWSPIAQIIGDGTGMLRFEDADVEPGARCGYRLGVREGGGGSYSTARLGSRSRRWHSRSRG
jgi:hypothetical protein